MRPKTIGILGGAGPLAGARLLDRILRFAQLNYGCCKDADFPKIILISFPFSEMLAEDIDVPKLRSELKNCLNELRGCGAEILAIACNTLHVFLDEEEKDLIRLPDAVAAKLKEEIPLVLCTSTSARYNLHNRFFPCSYLNASQQLELDSLIGSILQGEETIVEKLAKIIENQKAESVVLGCTELSLFREQINLPSKTIIDPLEIVAETLVEKAFRRNLCQ